MEAPPRLHIPGLRELWAETLGDPSVCVAVLDGPVDLTHPAFAGGALTELEPARAGDGAASLHGTHIASVIFGRHGGPVEGLAPHCRGVFVPIFRDEGGVLVPCSQVGLARAVLSALEAGANIINISGGQGAPSGEAGYFLEKAIRSCVDADVLVVAAAGNDGCRCLHVPGALGSVLAVGAMDAAGDPLDYSNWGYGSEGVLAPGDEVVGAAPGGGTRTSSGTSVATAVVSGVAALLMSLARKRGAQPSGSRVRFAITTTAKDCRHQKVDDCERLLAGRLDVRTATEFLKRAEDPMHMPEEDRGIDVAPGGRVGPTPPPASPAGVSAVLPATDPSGPAPSAGDSAGSAELPTYFWRSDGPGVLPSACGCSAGQAQSSPQKVFALGRLSFDYGTRSRRLYFANAMMKTAFAPPSAALPNIDDPGNLFRYLTRRGDRDFTIQNGAQFPSRAEVDSIAWVLQIDETPVYVIAPGGSLSSDVQDTLVSFLSDQLNEGAERISVAGVVAGQARLFTGETVPVIRPDIRGMFSWKTRALTAATRESAGASDAAEDDLREFLTRVYELTRNLGVTSPERALNYAVTDALLLQTIFNEVRTQHKRLEIDTFTVERSPLCRQDLDCWDVSLLFYDPDNLQRARRAYRFTVDVSDVVPVMIGKRSEFSVR